MEAKEHRTSRVVKILIAFLFVTAGVETWLVAGMRSELTDLRASQNATGEQGSWGPMTGPGWMGGSSGDEDSWSPYAEIAHMRQQMERMFRDSLDRFDQSSGFRSLGEPPDERESASAFA